MSNRFYEAVSRIARHEAETREVAAFGVVTAVHHKLVGFGDHAVDLDLRDRGLVLPKVPIAVGALGVTAAPAVGDLAVVMFAEGDLHGAVVVGFVHHPDLPAPDLEAEQIALSLPPGSAAPAASAVLDYAAPSLVLKIGRNTEVNIEDGAVTIQSGGASIAIDAGGSEEVTIDTGGASIVMTAGGDVTVDAQNTLSLKATQIEMKANATVKINGAILELN